MITTVSTDQSEILRNIMALYTKGRPFDLDPTYGNGGFYKNGVPEPRYKVDIAPRQPGVEQLDLRQLSYFYGENRFDSVVCDLPFIHAHGKESVMGNRFDSCRSQKELDLLHLDAAREFSKVLRPGGIVVWKCQDIVESGKQVWNHIRIHGHATNVGLQAEDLFILVRKSAIVGHNHKVQQHARKLHAFFWIFRRPK